MLGCAWGVWDGMGVGLRYLGEVIGKEGGYSVYTQDMAWEWFSTYSQVNEPRQFLRISAIY